MLHGSVARFRDGRFSYLGAAEGLVAKQVRTIHEDRSGRIWIGSDQGLHLLKDGRFQRFTRADGMAGDFVYSILEESDGTFWIGSFDGGLTRYRNGRFTAFPRSAGFPTGVVFQVLKDGQDYLWASSSTGIFRFSRQELNDFADGKSKQIRCNPRSACRRPRSGPRMRRRPTGRRPPASTAGSGSLHEGSGRHQP